MAQTAASDEPLLRATITELLRPVAGAATGDAVATATALEVATTPLGASAGGLIFKLDPTTGLQVRSASTFGPAFVERALTSGAGKASVAVNLQVATYDKLGDASLDQMRVSTITGPAPNVARTGNASLVIRSQTLVMTGTMGATDDLDLLVQVPMVQVKVEGITWVQRPDDVVAIRAEGSAVASGLGDLGVGGKFRFVKFGEGQPDPGGLALMVMARLPTGDKDNLRGLGHTRVLSSLIFSSGKGRFRPHANVGFDWWEKGLRVSSGGTQPAAHTIRHQVQYAAGVELEATPRFALIATLLGRHILGGGRLETQTLPFTNGTMGLPTAAGVESFTALAATGDSVRKLTLAPGLKWNLKGPLVLSLNALVPLSDNGLHDKFTPVVGLDMTF